MIGKIKAQPNCWPVGMAGLVIFFTLISCDPVYSQTCTISGSGSTNWANGNPPACQEGGNAGSASVIIIPSGRTIVFDGNGDTWNGTKMEVYGTLSISAPGQVTIESDILVRNGGVVSIDSKLNLGSTSGCGYTLLIENSGLVDIVSGTPDRLNICGAEIARGGTAGCNSNFPNGSPSYCEPQGGFSGPVLFNQFGVDNSLLPVNLLSFVGSQNENSIHLSWQTATELNNDYFTVERSQNGIHYEVIGEVQGYGTTNEQQDYEFVDSNPLQGLSYYRLRQTDFDGTTEIFRPVSVVFEGLASASASVFPNPFSQSELTVSLQGFAALSDVQLDVLNVNGAPVYSTVVNAGSSSAHAATLRLDFLPKGYYVVRLSGNNINTHLKLIKE